MIRVLDRLLRSRIAYSNGAILHYSQARLILGRRRRLGRRKTVENCPWTHTKSDSSPREVSDSTMGTPGLRARP